MVHWYDDRPGWPGLVAMIVMMLLFWGALVVGGVAVWRLLSRDTRGQHEPRPTGADALRILDERFARGEIDEEDYKRRRELLSAGR